MTAYTDFHYSPTGSGVISGAQVLEQTEQGINGLGQYVQDNVSGAIDTANEALTTARNADSNATAAINLANSFNAQIIAANQTAGNALTTAQSAQTTANAASSLATTANNSAATALNTANAASAGVTTLTGTVNSLGNRMTAAENAINANAGNITTLQNNLATTNANVTAAANAASSAQATATSAQSTATLARNQAYVLRYTGTTITGGGTIAYADIDNTDNIKAGDKIIDATGAVYAIASVDTANQTATAGATEIINLAVLPDLFNSANTWSGYTTFTNYLVSKESAAIPAGGCGKGIGFQDYQNTRLGYIQPYLTSDSEKRLLIGADSGDVAINSSLIPHVNNSYNLGSSSYQWNNLYAKNYYYNGVAWGLDKANVWTGNQTYTGMVILNSSSDVAEQFSQKLPQDVSTSSDALVRFNTLVDSAGHYVVTNIEGHWASYAAKSTTLKYKNDSTKTGTIEFRLDSSGQGLLYPPSPFECDLGNSTNKWSTLNGVNPGALSLPKGYTEEGATKDYINIASTIQTLDGTAYSYTLPDNGWIAIRAEIATLVHITIGGGYFGQCITHPTGSTLIAAVPFRKGDTVTLKVTANTLEYARFYPMQGNV